MNLPYHRINVLTGTKEARPVDSGSALAALLSRSKRPLLVLGAQALKGSKGGRTLLDFALQLGQAADIPICATAHTKKACLERGSAPATSYDLLEITNCLKTPTWKGVRGEGSHDLALFAGIRSDLLTAVLSTLKHFAPHLKTVTLEPYYSPHANHSLPNFLDEGKYWAILDETLSSLQSAREASNG